MRKFCSKRNCYGSRSRDLSGLFFGDRNTKYFHGVTAIRRRKNTYDMLQDDEGTWVGEQDKLESMVTNFFQRLFTADESTTPSPIYGGFPQVDAE